MPQDTNPDPFTFLPSANVARELMLKARREAAAWEAILETAERVERAKSGEPANRQPVGATA